MSAGGEDRNWLRDARRDVGRLGPLAAIELARDALLARRRARRSVAVGGGLGRIGGGVLRLATGNPLAGGWQVLTGGLQVWGVAGPGPRRRDAAAREVSLLAVEDAVTLARHRRPRELDKVLLGVRRQREELFTGRAGPPAGPGRPGGRCLRPGRGPPWSARPSRCGTGAPRARHRAAPRPARPPGAPPGWPGALTGPASRRPVRGSREPGPLRAC